MYRKTLSTIFWIPIFFLLLGAGIIPDRCSDSDSISSTNVDSEQKISDREGNFNGNLNDGDEFGSAIADIGDLEVDGVRDLAVGAPGDDDDGSDRGAVWILFMDDNGRVDLEQKISSDEGLFFGDLDNGDRFGSAVAGIGDLDNDGILDIAVGAPGDDDDGSDRGAVWILFLTNSGTVRQFRKISDDTGGFFGDLDDGDQFGGAVANIGDLDNDGVTDLAVGASRDDDGGSDKGAVWILFMNTDGSVKSHQKISSDEGGFDGNLDSDVLFGSAVTGVGDLDGDGSPDLAVGAPLDNDGGTDQGAVWILFLDDNGRVNREQKISTRDGNFEGDLNDGDRFGSALARIGDLDDNGTGELAVGAPRDDDGGNDRGAVWLLSVDDDGTVDAEAKLSSREGNFDGSLNDNDRFGSAVAGIGNLDGDGAEDIAVGAPLDDDGGTDRGAVWILFL